MERFVDAIQHIVNTPLPSLAFIVGFVLLVLGLIGKSSVYFDLDGDRRKIAVDLGSALMALGVILFLLSLILSLFSPQSSATYRVVNVQRNDVLNMRGDIGETKPIVGSIPADGKGIQLINRGRGTASGWVKVRYRNTEGWVNSYYLTPE